MLFQLSKLPNVKWHNDEPAGMLKETLMAPVGNYANICL